MTIHFETKFIREAQKSGVVKDWRDGANQWLVSINGEQFEYWTGTGLKDAPRLDDVLFSLTLDASALEMNFEVWCSEYGYNSDSIKALKTYQKCLENAYKLSRAGINIAAERERLQDY